MGPPDRRVYPVLAYQRGRRGAAIADCVEAEGRREQAGRRWDSLLHGQQGLRRHLVLHGDPGHECRDAVGPEAPQLRLYGLVVLQDHEADAGPSSEAVVGAEGQAQQVRHHTAPS